MNSIYKKVFIGALLFSTLSSAFADFWDYLTLYPGPKKDVITLVITANYKHPLIIAQLIQAETKQPYLLLPAANMKGIYFNPPRERSENALEIREDNLARFIRFLNPKQIVVLGDKRYVGEKYCKMIDKDIPVISVTGDNWQRIADRLSILLEAANVGGDYKKLSQELNSGLYTPTAAPKAEEKIPADLSVKDDVDDIAVAPKADVNAEKAPAPVTPAADAKKTDAAVKAAVKEPEAVMPKATPNLIKDK